MNLVNLAIGAALLCAAGGVVSAMLIVNALSRRGLPVNWLLLRLLLFKYLAQYKEITRKETGKVGPLFYSYIVAMNLALLLFALAMTLHTLK